MPDIKLTYSQAALLRYLSLPGTRTSLITGPGHPQAKTWQALIDHGLIRQSDLTSYMLVTRDGMNWLRNHPGAGK